MPHIYCRTKDKWFYRVPLSQKSDKGSVVCLRVLVRWKYRRLVDW